MTIIFAFSLFVLITTIQSQCPIGHLSFDEKKCYFILSRMSFFDAENDCKAKAENVSIGRDKAFLVSVSNAFDNGQLQCLYFYFIETIDVILFSDIKSGHSLFRSFCWIKQFR